MAASIRVANRTREQLQWLKDNGYESITNAAGIAIDQVYQTERRNMKQIRSRKLNDTQIRIAQKLDLTLRRITLTHGTDQGSSEIPHFLDIDVEGLAPQRILELQNMLGTGDLHRETITCLLDRVAPELISDMNAEYETLTS